MSLIFNIRLFTWLFIAFIVATILGTLSHECGHYIVAKLLGYEAELHYASVSYLPLTKDQAYNQVYKILIRAAGPLQTILTGTIGFLFLLRHRKSLSITGSVSTKQWFLIFLSLFWLRQGANFVIWTGAYIIKGKYLQRGDEIRLARYWGIPEWSIIAPTALIGFIILVVIVFKLLPCHCRLTFITAGLIGGIAGYFIWLIWFGKFILP